ncbi:MAG: ABC transporter permease [Oscillospiraceae bacterium]|nr:ABC transporter permease [Oscillospiraceae bacterium]
MNIYQSFRLAMKNLLLSKMRSLLTMLGIIIGVAAVIVIISIGDGVTSYINGQFESMGSNLIMVYTTSPSPTRTVDDDDMFALAEDNRDSIQAVSPIVSVSSRIKYGTESYSTTINGVSEEYDLIGLLTVDKGRFLQYTDVANLKNVCVVGSYVEENTFNNNALGQTLRINGYSYTVVGVLAEKAGSTQSSDDDVVYIPYTSAQRLNGSAAVYNYYLSAVSEDTMDKAQWAVERFLTRELGEDDFMVLNMAEILGIMKSVQDVLVTALVGIAAISLLVGGIGIMNIMLVTVTERTREIGIRKSLGAKRRDIRLQFIIEAGATSAVGGVIGIIMGAIFSGVAGRALGITATASLRAILLSFFVSLAVGVIFGYLPANRAARLNPIDALRHE